MNQVVYYSDLDVLILLYQTCTSLRNLLEEKETLYNVSSKFGIKSDSFRELIRHYNKKYMTSYCFQQSIPECYIYAARSGDLPLIQKCIPLIKENYSFYWMKACLKAIKYKSRDVYEFLVSDDIPKKFALKIFATAAYYGNFDLVIERLNLLIQGLDKEFYYTGCLSAAKGGRDKIFHLIYETAHARCYRCKLGQKLKEFARISAKNGHLETCNYIMSEISDNKIEAALEEIDVLADVGYEDECLLIINQYRRDLTKEHYIQTINILSSRGLINLMTILIKKMIDLKYKVCSVEILTWIDNLKDNNQKDTAKWIKSKISDLLE